MAIWLCGRLVPAAMPEKRYTYSRFEIEGGMNSAMSGNSLSITTLRSRVSRDQSMIKDLAAIAYFCSLNAMERRQRDTEGFA